jgi:hypothetical protein
MAVQTFIACLSSFRNLLAGIIFVLDSSLGDDRHGTFHRHPARAKGAAFPGDVAALV